MSPTHCSWVNWNLAHAYQNLWYCQSGRHGAGDRSCTVSTGLRTVAALDERSKRTRQLAAAATSEDVGSLKHLVAESDVVLSVLVPAATQADQKVALAIRALDKPILYADCKAIAKRRSHPLTGRGDRNTL